MPGPTRHAEFWSTGRAVAFLLLILTPPLVACDADTLGLGDDEDEEEQEEEQQALPVPDPPTARIDDGFLVVEWDPADGAESHNLLIHSSAWHAETFRNVQDSMLVENAASPHRVHLDELNAAGGHWKALDRTGEHQVHLEPGLFVGFYFLSALVGGEEGESVIGPALAMPSPEIVLSYTVACEDGSPGIWASTQLYGPGDSIVVYSDTSPDVDESSDRLLFTGDVNAPNSVCRPSSPGVTYYYRAIGYNEFGSSGLSPVISQRDLR